MNRLSKFLIIFSIFISIAAIIIAAIYYLPRYSPSNQLAQQLPINVNENKATIQEKEYTQLFFVGDMMFDRGIRYYAQKNGGNDFIFEKISSTLLDNDIVIGNLEGPITENKSISLGTIAGSTNNYYFTFDPSWADTLYKNNVKIVNIGNNHILNFKRGGLYSTKKYLDQANIGYFGSPDYPKSISSEINGTKITFISYNEFSYLPEGIEVKSTIEEIQKAKGFSDIIIVLPHWGIEYNLNVSENQRTIARDFINAGADIIIGTHPHVIEPIEIYKGKRIYYSLGNFIFDQYFNDDVRNSMGVIVKINKKTRQLDFSEKYFYLDNNGQTIEKTEVK